MNDVPRQIKLPTVPTMTKADNDLGAAYIDAVVQIPQKLEELVNLLDAATQCLIVLADATRKRAIADSIFEIDEYKKELEELTAEEDEDSDAESVDAD